MPTTITPQLAREAEAACVFTNLETLFEASAGLFNATLAPAGMSIEQLGYLVCLRGMPSLAVGSLAQRKCRDPAEVRNALLVMQTLGWVDVPRDDETPIGLTTAGVHKLDEGAGYWNEVQSQVVEAMGGDDAWKRTLSRLSHLFASIMSAR